MSFSAAFTRSWATMPPEVPPPTGLPRNGEIVGGTRPRPISGSIDFQWVIKCSVETQTFFAAFPRSCENGIWLSISYKIKRGRIPPPRSVSMPPPKSVSESTPTNVSILWIIKVNDAAMAMHHRIFINKSSEVHHSVIIANIFSGQCPRLFPLI